MGNGIATISTGVAVAAPLRIVGAEQIRHRALLEPQTVQPPLAAGIDQPIAHQRLQNMLPARALARVGQAILD
jgi:hypothetical protein